MSGFIGSLWVTSTVFMIFGVNRRARILMNLTKGIGPVINRMVSIASLWSYRFGSPGLCWLCIFVRRVSSLRTRVDRISVS